MTPEPEYYWDLYLKDNRVIPIPPKSVETVKRKLAAREVIMTSRGVIPFAEVKTFEPTSRRFIDVKLIEDVAQAFKEPIINELDDGTRAVKSKWIKRLFTSGEYSKEYRNNPAYHRLGEENGMTWVAYVLPVHLIDPERHVELDDKEIKLLTK